MSFEFKRIETVAQGLRRIAVQQVDLILADVKGRRRISRDQKVHEARKRLKRLRALLRLTRESAKPKLWRKVDAGLRDAGRALSGVRDAKVGIEAFDLLLKNLKSPCPAETFQPIRARLLAQHRRSLQSQSGEGLDEVGRLLQAVKHSLKIIPIHGDDFSSLRRGLKRNYRQGRQAFTVARHDREAAALHEWRKRVKDLRHHAELLKPIWPAVLERFEGKAHELANCLGEDHDLFVLRQFLLTEAASLSVPTDLETLLESIDDRRRELQKQSMHLGERVYSEKPRDFLERMENYWNAWKVGQAHDPSSMGAD